MISEWAIHDECASCYTAASSDNGQPEEIHERRSDGSCKCGRYGIRREFSPTHRVTDAPGYEDFSCTVVPGLHAIAAVDGRGDLTVVLDIAGEPYVVPARCVHSLDLP